MQCRSVVLPSEFIAGINRGNSLQKTTFSPKMLKDELIGVHYTVRCLRPQISKWVEYRQTATDWSTNLCFQNYFMYMYIRSEYPDGNYRSRTFLRTRRRSNDIILSTNYWSILLLCFTLPLESAPFISLSTSFWYQFLHFRLIYFPLLITCSSSDSPLCSSITPSLFHFRLKTNLPVSQIPPP